MVNLLDPIIINCVELKNRLVMPPIGTDLATGKGEVTEKHLKYYRLRAREIGLVIVEHSYVDIGGRFTETQIGIHDDGLIPGLEKLVGVIHDSGAAAAIQINHSGGKCVKSVCGIPPVGPSSGQFSSISRFWREPTRRLEASEIIELTEKFGESARRAWDAGFDAVEIHGAHGWLLNQFASPLTNKREDQYGGSSENRFRFPLEIIKKVRSRVAPGFPVFYRLGADDFIPGGLTVDESERMAAKMIDAGVDALDISGGLCGIYHPTNKNPGFFIPIAERIKEVVSVPVIGVGGITEAKLANRYVTEGRVDLVAIGRALMNDEDWGVREIKSFKET